MIKELELALYPKYQLEKALRDGKFMAAKEPLNEISHLNKTEERSADTFDNHRYYDFDNEGITYEITNGVSANDILSCRMHSHEDNMLNGKLIKDQSSTDDNNFYKKVNFFGENNLTSGKGKSKTARVIKSELVVVLTEK
jgi:hypothetical protein